LIIALRQYPEDVRLILNEVVVLQYVRPVDFSHFEIHVSRIAVFNPAGWNGTSWTGTPNSPADWDGLTNTLHTISPTMPITIVGLTSGQKYYIKIVSVDKSNLRSNPTVEAELTAGNVLSDMIAQNSVRMSNLDMSILDYTVPQILLSGGGVRKEPTGYGNCIFWYSVSYSKSTDLDLDIDNTYGFSYFGGASLDEEHMRMLFPNTSSGNCYTELSGYIKAPNGLASGMMVLYLYPIAINLGTDDNLKYCGANIIYNGKTYSQRLVSKPISTDSYLDHGVLTTTTGVYKLIFTDLDTNVLNQDIAIRFVNEATSPVESEYLWELKSWALAYCANSE
jgi:hypothetical protein